MNIKNSNFIVLLLFFSLTAHAELSQGFYSIKDASDCDILDTVEVGLFKGRDIDELVKEKVQSIGGNLAVYDSKATKTSLWHGVDGTAGFDVTLSVKAYKCK